MIGANDKLRKWLKRALYFVPLAYAANFLYALSKGETGGTFGDTFGAANALFSGTALLMLVYAVILQRDELKIVKEEREDTRKLLAGQEELTKQQHLALSAQTLNQSFFSLLDLIHQERIRLDQTQTTVNFFGAEASRSALATSAESCRTLLLNKAINTEFEPQHKLELDKSADEAFHLISLISSCLNVAEINPDKEQAEQNKALLQSQIGPSVAICFAWFHASCHGQNPRIAKAYDTLWVHASIAPAELDAMKKLLRV